MWEYLGLTRVYTKRKGSPPDIEDPVVLSEIRKGTTVKSLCANISSELLREFNYALVWGTSAKHSPQRCGLSHKLDDEDVVQIVSKVRIFWLLFCSLSFNVAKYSMTAPFILLLHDRQLSNNNRIRTLLLHHSNFWTSTPKRDRLERLIRLPSLEDNFESKTRIVCC